MTGYYSREGREISFEQWCDDYETYHSIDGGIHVAETFVGDVRISTVYIGLDHSFGFGPPLIFETMVFATDEQLEGQCWRYTTELQALAGHDQAVAHVRALT